MLFPLLFPVISVTVVLCPFVGFCAVGCLNCGDPPVEMGTATDTLASKVEGSGQMEDPLFLLSFLEGSLGDADFKTPGSDSPFPSPSPCEEILSGVLDSSEFSVVVGEEFEFASEEGGESEFGE